jgi:hypothetical protein
MCNTASAAAEATHTSAAKAGLSPVGICGQNPLTMGVGPRLPRRCRQSLPHTAAPGTATRRSRLAPASPALPVPHPSTASLCRSPIRPLPRSAGPPSVHCLALPVPHPSTAPRLVSAWTPGFAELAATIVIDVEITHVACPQPAPMRRRYQCAGRLGGSFGSCFRDTATRLADLVPCSLIPARPVTYALNSGFPHLGYFTFQE